MNDCKVVIECRDEKLNITGEQVSLVELACMLGYLASLVVWESVKRGLGADDIKDHMLDIFLAATADLTDDKAAEISGEV